MLGIVTTLSTFGTTAPQAVDSQIEIRSSTEYLINTDNIVEMKVYGTTDSDLKYKLSTEEDRSPEFHLRVNETNSAIDTLADTSANSNMVVLNVFYNDYGEDALTFAECASLSTTAKYFNITDIVWGEENNAQNKSMLLIAEGGNKIRKIFVDHGLDMLIDLIVTGTTTTTTSSTSSTTTSA
jgi:hypothetical protein